jgi:hypothetical protein
MALMLLAASFGLLIGLLSGGNLRAFAGLRLRATLLVLISLLIQVVAFTPLRASIPGLSAHIPALYLFSMGLLVVWVGLNWRIPGMSLLAAGLLCNLLAIAANDGYMPVSAESLRIAGRNDLYAEGAIYNNSAQHGGAARLVLLTDILAVPAAVPFANVFSIGDVLIACGAAWLCYKVARQRREEAAARLFPGMVPERGNNIHEP